MGDDLPDLRVMQQVGLSVAPCDAHTWVRERVNWRTAAAWGHGAARELCDLLLASQGHVEALWPRGRTSTAPASRARHELRAILTLVLLAGAVLSGSRSGRSVIPSTAPKPPPAGRITCCTTSN